MNKTVQKQWFIFWPTSKLVLGKWGKHFALINDSMIGGRNLILAANFYTFKVHPDFIKITCPFFFRNYWPVWPFYTVIMATGDNRSGTKLMTLQSCELSVCPRTHFTSQMATSTRALFLNHPLFQQSIFRSWRLKMSKNTTYGIYLFFQSGNCRLT